MTEAALQILRDRRAFLARQLETANGEWAQLLEQDIQIIDRKLRESK